jgi:hypothetical protein
MFDVHFFQSVLSKNSLAFMGGSPFNWKGVKEVNQGCDVNKYEKEIQGQPGIGIILIPLFFNHK